MKLPHTRLPVAVATLAIVLAACASPPSPNAVLEEAKAAYQRAAGDPLIARSSPVELRKAQQALQRAEAAQRAGEDAASVDHYASLARLRTEVAIQAGKVTMAERAAAAAGAQRDRIVLDSRTREADDQRALAERARVEAQAQRTQAEASRRLAEERLAATQAANAQTTSARRLAEERLASAQAANAQMATARARTTSLEEQLAELKARQTPRGMVLTLGDMLFDTGRAELNPGASRSIDQLAAFLTENTGRSVTVEGYTDSLGSDSLNQVLSERRAIAVKNALLDRGIVAARVSARGFGEASPVASNDTAAGRQQNRRVEIVISDKAN